MIKIIADAAAKLVQLAALPTPTEPSMLRRARPRPVSLLKVLTLITIVGFWVGVGAVALIAFR